MSEMKVTRRQFVGGAAVAAAATALPLASVTTAAATPSGTFPGPSSSWTPLDPTAAARVALEIYRGKYNGSLQSG